MFIHNQTGLRCESQVQNPAGEAAALLDAARLFLRAEENLQSTSAFSVGEHIEFFTSCCLRAAKVTGSYIISISSDI